MGRRVAQPARHQAEDAELEHVRAALARGYHLNQALDEASHPATGRAGLGQLRRRITQEVAGAGPRLQPYLEMPDVTDVLVGAGQIWLDRGNGLERVGESMEEAEVRAVAVRMAAAAGRRLDDASPIADATLAGGVRLCAVLPPLSDDGTLICLRTRRSRALTMAELVASGSVTPPLDEVLSGLVSGRASCLVSGATGAGKTTILAALLSMVPRTERIVCIEEASELAPSHPHVVHLQERGANVQGVGAVTMTDLVRAALRMRPDRVVLGECRGPEVREVLTALNTGHEGGWATLHANSPADVPARLVALGALAGMSQEAVWAQAASAIDVVVHVARRAGQRGLRRVVEEVAVVGRAPSGELVCTTALFLDSEGRVRPGPAAGELEALLAARRGGCGPGSAGAVPDDAAGAGGAVAGGAGGVVAGAAGTAGTGITFGTPGTGITFGTPGTGGTSGPGIRAGTGAGPLGPQGRRRVRAGDVAGGC